jgi:hypothetical protein
MKATIFSRFGAPDVLAVADVPDRMPGHGEARVRVEAASVNPSDVKNVAGAMSQTTLPRIPGRDFAGVVEVGPDAWIGAEVWGSGNAGFTCDGSHAQYIVVPVASLRRKPETLSFDEAASVGVTYWMRARCAAARHSQSSERAAALVARWPKSRGAWARARSLAWTGRRHTRTRLSHGQRTHSLPVRRTLPPPCVTRSVAAAQTWCSMPWAASCFQRRWPALRRGDA